ncbi:hypothetical protein IQ230_19550 [Gloeocapsopsis crepidinum LEGE 06123]|uniref:Uncharacterized protein n=1 Tax=Gloeocapsopsis crepidinum LEGE 06123 TaxID=588587 RepID=A0ABR9UW73_9CHRO|nr:hypothetical protein [Gloeocapsopsis crepidinum]MBE9192504.1 hypothetical protein [Gloeocapsopsis crepidinum LEGE 06123]
MSNQPRVPNLETRVKSVSKLRELVKRMDSHILDLEEFNSRLEADIRNSPLTAYRLGKIERATDEKN